MQTDTAVPVPDAPPLDVELLRPMLTAALTWLYDTDQPDDAVLQHHGVTMWDDTINRSVQVCPIAYAGLPVIVVDVTRKIRRWPDIPHPDGAYRYYEIVNGYAPGELEQIAALIADLGYEVDSTWNGAPGCASGSVALTRIAGSSGTPVNRYFAHCPKHNTVFCFWEGCSWYRDGRARVVLPSAPEGVRCV